MMSDAARIAQVLHGHRCGGGWLCRCPLAGHGRGRGDRTPSLFVKDGDRRVLVTCFAGCASSDVIDQLRRMGLLFASSGGTRTPTWRRSPLPVSKVSADLAALDLWSASLPLSGTLGDRYLRLYRGLSGPFPESLRFLPNALHPHVRRRFPALIAAVEGSDSATVAVQVTYLHSSGAKAQLRAPRLTFGRLADGAIRLATPTEILGLAEGTEDALSAITETGCPCWAVAGALRLHRVTLPTPVRELHVFADDDQPGRDAARRASHHYAVLGRRVVVHLPPAGFKDWGEVAQAKQTNWVAA